MKTKKVLLPLIMVMLLSVALSVCFIGCGCDDNKNGNEIVLSFDKTEAYFSASTALLPIKGETLSSADRFEMASIVIRANEAVKMQLSVKLIKENANVTGIMIMTGSGDAVGLENGLVLYESASEETEATVVVTIYLAKDAPTSLKGETIDFQFALTYWE